MIALTAIFYWTFAVSVITTVEYDLKLCEKHNIRPCTLGGWMTTDIYPTRIACEQARKEWLANTHLWLVHSCQKKIIGWSE